MLITYDHGKIFPLPMLMIGWTLTVGGIGGLIGLLLGAFGGNWVLLLALAIGGYILTARTGTQLDTENRNFREYTEYFWIKTGKWQDFFRFPQYGCSTDAVCHFNDKPWTC